MALRQKLFFRLSVPALRGEQAVARVVAVLDDIFGLPVTSGAVGVLEGRQYAPGDALSRPHNPLEIPAVVGGDTS